MPIVIRILYRKESVLRNEKEWIRYASRYVGRPAAKFRNGPPKYPCVARCYIVVERSHRKFKWIAYPYFEFHDLKGAKHAQGAKHAH